MSKTDWQMVRLLLLPFEGLANSMAARQITVPLPLLDQRKFAGCIQAAVKACQNQNPTQLAMQMFIAGTFLGHDNYRLLFGKEQLHREQGRAGGKMNALSEADMRRQLKTWDEDIRRHGGKKRLAMRQLGIKSSTYYKYARACR